VLIPAQESLHEREGPVAPAGIHADEAHAMQPFRHLAIPNNFA
jgi:hypothetical protein